jgi:hypothetical protein
VYECLPRQQDVITGRRGPGESDLEQAYRSRFHLQWTTRRDAGARQPSREEKSRQHRVGASVKEDIARNGGGGRSD